MAIRKSSSSGIPFGNTAGRPSAQTGQPYFNGETSRLELYTQNSGWQNIVQETPGVSSITGTYLESAGTGTITISGTNFVSGAYATAIGSNGVQYDAASTTYNSLVQLTAIFNNLSAAYEPYDIKVTNPSNLFGLIPDALYINQSPVWQHSSGSLGTFNEGIAITPISALATDPEASALTFAVASGSLPSGLSLNTTTGVISGTPSGVDSSTTYNFSISVTDSANTTITRSFNITINSIISWNTVSGSLGTLSYALSQGYSYQLSATALQNTITYSVQSGSLPNGLSLSSTGLISGDATAVESNTTFTFTVRASDGTVFSDRSFNLTVQSAVIESLSSSGTWVSPITGEIILTMLGGGGGGSTGNGEWAHGGGGGSYLVASFPAVSGQSYAYYVGGGGAAQTSCNNAPWGNNGKGGNTTFSTLVASGGSGGTQRNDSPYSTGGGIGISNVTTGASRVVKNYIGQNGNGGDDGMSYGGSNGLKNIENNSTYGSGAAGTPNFTPGVHATGNGNGGGGGASCQQGHRGGGNGSAGILVITR